MWKAVFKRLASFLKARNFWALLIVGIAIRCVALNQPLIDAHNTRQCQTAILTKNMMTAPGFSLAAHADWMGDEPGKLFYELPIYNYLTIGLTHLLGNLDVSGKLISIALWVAAFGLNARIMAQTLTPLQARWGNALFVFSPLSIFFGQAFQPETLTMALSLGMIGSFLRYQATHQNRWFIGCIFLSLIAVTVKANEISHLFILIAFLALAREGWSCAFKLRYWIFITLLGVTTHLYGEFMTAINSATFPEWTAAGNLEKFTGNWMLRLEWFFYAKIGAYIVLLLCTPVVFGIAIIGIGRIFQTKRAQLYFFWLIALVFYYLFWGPGTSFAHSYYNLPALPVACGFFGIGMAAFVGFLRKQFPSKANPLVSLSNAAVWILLLAGSVFGSLILFWPDRGAYEGSLALRSASKGKEGFAFCFSNHSRYGPGYTHYATLFYYSGLKGWNDNPHWSPAKRTEILRKCRWAIELKYEPQYQFPGRRRTWFSNQPRKLLDTSPVQNNPSFELRQEASTYRLWERKPPFES